MFDITNKYTSASLVLLLKTARMLGLKLPQIEGDLDTARAQRYVETHLRTQVLPRIDAQMPSLPQHFEKRAAEVYALYYNAAQRLNVPFNPNDMPLLPSSNSGGGPPVGAPLASWSVASGASVPGTSFSGNLLLSFAPTQPAVVQVQLGGSLAAYASIIWPGGVVGQIQFRATASIVTLPIGIAAGAPTGTLTLTIIDSPSIDIGATPVFTLNVQAPAGVSTLGEIFGNKLAGFGVQPVGTTVSFADTEPIETNIKINGYQAQVDVVERMGVSSTKSAAFVTSVLPVAANSIPGSSSNVLLVETGIGSVPAQAGNYPYDLAAKPVVLRMRPERKMQDYEASSSVFTSSRVLCGAGSGRTSGPDLYRVERRYCLFSATGQPEYETSCALANMTLERIAGFDCVLVSVAVAVGYMKGTDETLFANNTQPGLPKFDRIEFVLPVGYQVAFLDPFTGEGGVGTVELCKAFSGGLNQAHRLSPGNAPAWHTIIYNPATITAPQAMALLEGGAWGVLYGAHSQMHIGKGLGPSDQTLVDWRKAGVSLESLAARAESNYSSLRSAATSGLAGGEFSIARAGWHAVMGSESPQNTGGDRIFSTNFMAAPAPKAIARLRLESEMQSRRRAYAVYHLDEGRHVLGGDFLGSYNEGGSAAGEVPQPVSTQLAIARDSLGSMATNLWPCLNSIAWSGEISATLPERIWDQPWPGRTANVGEDLYNSSGNGWEYDADHTTRFFDALTGFLLGRSWVAFDRLEGMMAKVTLIYPAYEIGNDQNYWSFNRASKCVHAWGDRDLALTPANVGKPLVRRREWTAGQGVTLGPLQTVGFITGRGLGWSTMAFCLGFSVALPAIQDELWTAPSTSLGQNHNWIALILRAFDRWTTWHGFSSANDVNNTSASNPYQGQVDFVGKTGARPGGPHNLAASGQAAFEDQWWPYEFSWQMNFTAEGIFAAMSIAVARGSFSLASSYCRKAAGAMLFRARSAGADPYNTPQSIRMDLTACMSRGTQGLNNPMPSESEWNQGLLYWRQNNVADTTYWMMGLRIALRLAPTLGATTEEIQGLIRRIWGQGNLTQEAFLDFMRAFWVSLLDTNFPGSDQRGLGWYADTLATL